MIKDRTRRLTVRVLVAMGIGLLLLGLRSSFKKPNLVQAWEPVIPEEFSELTVACTVLGKFSPSLENIPLEQRESLLDALSQLFLVYRGGRFDDFLRMHGKDVDAAASARVAEVEHLFDTLQTDLGVDTRQLKHTWIDGLRAFWDAYYICPPVLAFDPSSASVTLHDVTLHDETSKDRVLDQFVKSMDKDIENKRSFHSIRCNHRLAIPHRKTVKTIAEEEGSVTLCDFEIAADLGGQQPCPVTIHLRYVWDSSERAWFLYRALTLYPDTFVPVEGHGYLLF